MAPFGLQAGALAANQAAACKCGTLPMTYEDHLYHAKREQQCRLLAESASDAQIRRCHFELAELHADRAARYMPALPRGKMKPAGQ